MKTLDRTQFNFPGQQSVYRGKVRDVYSIEDNLLVMIASDRISAFDHILPRGIPYKGQVLNQLASKFLDVCRDVVPNWKIASPDPNVTVGYRCETYPVEMVVRGYLTGHAARVYNSGGRKLCGIVLPEGLRENERFNKPIITPTTKAHEGHDEDISRGEIIRQNLVGEADYQKLEEYALKLFQRGSEIADKQGLILVDTKYEFGKYQGEIFLIDEIHTPDSSRYFYKDTYQELLEKHLPQRQLSKEFVREWLMENGFQGKEDQKIPDMCDEKIEEISNRYIELYEKITGEKFEPDTDEDIEKRIERNVSNFLQNLVL